MRAIVVAVSLALVGCSASKSDPKPAAGTTKTVKLPKQAITPNAVAYFAGGCFWGVEHYLEQMDGVASVESGYMGGHVKAPSYEQVVSKKTGHIETVRVRYDSARVSYKALAKRFFEIHDPTQADGQGPDIGPQYISAVFFNSPSERADAESLMTDLRKRGFKVVTKLYPAKKFWIAEDYHQNYYDRTGKEPYCHTRVRRFDKPVIN